MLHDLPGHPVVRDTLEEAGAVLDRDPLSLDSAEALGSNITVQLALLIAGVAAARVLAASDACPDFVAGHSIGAFAAAVTSGALGFSDAVRVVELRANAMQNAYPEGYGMAVILGLDEHTVAGLVGQINSENSPLYATNINGPYQVAVSGANDALERVIELARRHGANRAERLCVPSPSHSPLMDRVAEKLSRALGELKLRRPEVPYVSNIGGRRLYDPEEIQSDLAWSVARPVRWHEATSLLFELGVRLFVEMPPGDVLTRLAESAFPRARCFAVGSGGFDSARLLIQREKLRSH